MANARHGLCAPIYACAGILDLEKVPWTQLTAGHGIDSLAAFTEGLAADAFPLLLLQFTKL